MEVREGIWWHKRDVEDPIGELVATFGLTGARPPGGEMTLGSKVETATDSCRDNGVGINFEEANAKPWPQLTFVHIKRG